MEAHLERSSKMKFTKILALIMALCMVLSIGAMASGMPDTSQGGKATSRPPDNSTRAVNILGGQAAVYIEYTDNGYTLTQNITDAYEVEFQNELKAPASGEPYVMDGVKIVGSRMDWNEETEAGNSNIVINALTDETTTFVLGGEKDYYEAPNGQMYNSVLISTIDENEPKPDSAVETARGVNLAFNGKAITIKNAYMDGDGTGRPTIHIPSKTRDKNATQLPDLIVEDSWIDNSTTRAMLLMGGDVWFLNSVGYTNAWGALSYDNTSTTMYVVNSDVQNIGSGGYAIYDAAGCTAYVYGSKVLGGNVGITVCRNAALTVDSLDKADEAATAPYTGDAAALMTPAVTDGRTVIVAHDQPIMMHADMSGPDSQAVAYISNAYISTLEEDLVFADGTTYADWAKESTGASALANAYQSGAVALLKCHNGKIVFDNCDLRSRTGLLVHSQFVYDSMASGIYPQDGAEYVGDEIIFRNMSAEGDILHEDYMRKMDLAFENAQITGAVKGTTLAAWNNYWTEQVEALPAEELGEASGEMSALDTALQKFIYNDTYETMWGVRMTMDPTSVWTVTDDSNLYSFTMEEGAVVKAPEGKSLAIYVDCAMSNAQEAYDISVGTKIDAFEPGVEYSGVVILVEEEAASAGGEKAQIVVNDELLAALGVETYVEDGTYNISLGTLLEALGAELSYDEETGVLTVVDSIGLVGALLDVVE